MILKMLFTALFLCSAATVHAQDAIFGEGAGNSRRILLSDCTGSIKKQAQCVLTSKA
jgi:hypothetical protein